MLRFSIRINSALKRMPEAIIASVAVSNGRVYFVSDANLYCIGKKTSGVDECRDRRSKALPNPNRPVTHVQVVPTELILKPGDNGAFSRSAF